MADTTICATNPGVACTQRYRSNIAFPTVFDNMLSYEQQLQCLLDYVNKIAEEVDAISLENLQKYINQLFDNFKLEYNAILKNTEKRLDLKYTGMIGDISTSLTNQIMLLQQKIEFLNSDYKYYVDLWFKNIIKYIDEVNENGFKIYDPTTGKFSRVEVVINNVYNILRCCALNAIEYDYMRLSAEKYDSLCLTATEFDIKAKWYLWWWVIDRDYSPFTGEFTTQHQINGEIVQYLAKDGITTDEYDNLLITAETYDNKNVTAYNFTFTNWSAA